ncbi:MAG: NADPH-dependent assimilatory sulfite reductase hemoprotein subunit, partial [Chitinophagaceae bacterium]
HIAGEHSTGVIKITTRQTVQLHGIIKSHIKPTIKAFNEAHLNSIATCGDINRNVLCTSNPTQSPLYDQVFEIANQICDLLLPKTHAYHEIWLDGEKITDKDEEKDPLYQDRYLPRKFKIGVVIPPNNDIDVLANDLALIAIIENDELKGFNLAIGGGLSTTHGNPDTYARLATVIGFTDTSKTLKAVYEIVTIQRDYGNRSDRKLARLKYTVDKYGMDWYRMELEHRTGFAIEPARTYEFNDRSDYYGWTQSHEGNWHYTLFIENGRVHDEPELPLKTALLEVAKSGRATFRFTPNQNLILSDVAPSDKSLIDDILDRYGIIKQTAGTSLVRKNSMSCVALPTCPLALAEAQRYFPSLISKIEPLLFKNGLDRENIIIRMTGCPNGCARSYNAEIGFVGTAPGRYNLHIGGDFEGTRLNKIYRESLDETGILNTLDELFTDFKRSGKSGERFGDFSFRKMNEVSA